jgi:signal peptidase I
MVTLLRRPVERLTSAVLTVGAVLGALCLCGTVLAPLVGIHPLIFLSGSMSPTIPAGSLALAHDVAADDIAVGDILTVPINGTFVTHRVVEVTHRPGSATVLLRGDGNKVADDQVHTVVSAPRTEIWMPEAGRVVAWFSHAPGVYVLAAWVALVVSTLRRRKTGQDGGPPSDDRPPRPTGGPKLWLAWQRRRGSRQAAPRRLAPQLARGVGFTAAGLLAPVVVPGAATAAWAETVGVTGATLRSATIQTPVLRCGTTGLDRSMTLLWDALPGASAYRVSYRQTSWAANQYATLDVPGSQTSITVDSSNSTTYGNGGTMKVQAIYGVPTWISTASNELAYFVKSNGTCQAA